MAGWKVERPHHIGICASDFERSLAFYIDVLGFTLLDRRHIEGELVAQVTGLTEPRAKVAMLRAGGQTIELFEYEEPRGTSMVAKPCDTGITHFALVVDDIESAYRELSGKGVQFNAPPVLISHERHRGWRATYLHDPDGIIIELLSPSDA